MKTLILCSIILLATATYQWPRAPVSDTDSPSDDSDTSCDEGCAPDFGNYPSSDDSDSFGICWPHTYGRPTEPCNSQDSLSSDDECYPDTQEGFLCEGAVCYGPCPNNWQICGAMCVKTMDLCVHQVIDEAFAVEQALMKMAANLTNISQGSSVNPFNVPHVSEGPAYPYCH